MSLEAETQEFLDYLHANESVRSLIKAAPNETLLYSGGFFQSIFNELEMEKRKNANLARLQTLSDVLELVPAPPRCADRTLKRYLRAFQSDLMALQYGRRCRRSLPAMLMAACISR
jgi:hypothetical protein